MADKVKKLDTDVAIVGGGPGGCTLAKDLTQMELTVAVDEAVINPTASVPGQARKVRRNSRGEPILEFPANTRVRRR